MAERAEEPEAEAPGGVEPIAPAAGLVIGLRKGRSRDKDDPKLDAFLDEQTRLIRLQTEHLHEQRELTLSRLKLGRWKDRVSLALQSMTALVGLAVAGAIGVMAWQAHQDHGLIVAPFSVPPDLAQRGLTGQVVASRVLDRLSELKAQTVSTRPASAYANDWGDDIKVEIPETGVSIGELNRWLREWLGGETRVTGEVVHTASGLQLTARAGEEPGTTAQGAETDMDALIGQSAEALYRQTQPYRYAEYLASRGRRDEASAAFADLARSGRPEDRPWAYAGWASILQVEGRHYDAIRMAQASIALNPRLAPPYQTLGVSSDVVGRWEIGVDNPRVELALIHSGRGVGYPKDSIAERIAFLEAVDAYYHMNVQSAAALMTKVTAFDLEGRAAGYAPQHLRARALAALHEITAADQAAAGPLDTNNYQAIPARGETMDDWAEVSRRLEEGRNDPALAGDAQKTVVMPLLAQAYAHLGRLDEAKALVTQSPLDCYRCLAARGEIATLERDWASADRWYAALDRQTPSRPLSPAPWAVSLLARGNVDGALAKAQEGHRRAPYFADPLELWGEALMRKGDYAGATAKFAEAAKYAPRWGRDRLRWGQALLQSGKPADAKAQFEAAKGMDLSAMDRAEVDAALARIR
jgi:tetratricopeptide (TPR) repeat protein